MFPTTIRARRTLTMRWPGDGSKVTATERSNPIGSSPPSQIAIVVSRVFAQISEEGVSRLDMALFMRYGNRVLDNPAPPLFTAPDFTDWPPEEEDRVNEEVAESVAYGAIRGWFKGYPDGTFRSEETITAGQMAKVITRAFPRGISRAEMADFIRHGNGAVVSHEASRAWDRVEAAYVTTQVAWRDACDAWISYRPVVELAELAWDAETAAFTATAVAWRADVDFWETVDNRRRIENEALSSAMAAADAWDAAAAAKKTLGGDRVRGIRLSAPSFGRRLGRVHARPESGKGGLGHFPSRRARHRFGRAGPRLPPFDRSRTSRGPGLGRRRGGGERCGGGLG